MLEFREWPKIPRLNRDMIVTEKIDGTNAAVIIQPCGLHGFERLKNTGALLITSNTDGLNYAFGTQSRKRIITPGKQSDNAGFAAWAYNRAQEFVGLLGEGYHYGEWWGKGVQRGYGLDGKRFSLFNVTRYASHQLPDGVDLVPTLYEGPFNQNVIDGLVLGLRNGGSIAVPGAEAEGVVVFHKASGHVYKVLCLGDELPKGIVPRQEREVNA